MAADVMPDLPDFLNRKLWTKEQHQQNEWNWQDVLEETRRKTREIAARQRAQRELIKAEKELHRWRSTNYIPGTASATMRDRMIATYERKVTALRAELPK